MGLAVSERLARSHPGRLVLADVQGDKVAGVAERLRDAGTDCVAVPRDLTDPDSIAALAQVAGVPTRLALVDGGPLLGMWRRSADLRDPVGTAQDRHSLGYPPAIGGLRHDVAIRDTARLAVREQADALAQRPGRAVAVLGDDDVDGVVGQRMARARIGPERRDRGGAMVDALPEVGDV